MFYIEVHVLVFCLVLHYYLTFGFNYLSIISLSLSSIIHSSISLSVFVYLRFSAMKLVTFLIAIQTDDPEKSKLSTGLEQ